MYERIVVGHDASPGSLAALAWGSQLARSWDLPLDVVTVVTGDDEPITADGPPVRVVHSDDPAVELIRIASAGDGGLLCLGTRVRGGLAEAVVGSVATTVIRDLGAPLVVAGPEVVAPVGDRVQRLLVCLDGSGPSASVLPVVRDWAGALDLEVRLLHVAPPSEGDAATDPDPYPDAEERQIIASVARSAEELRDAGTVVDWQVVEASDVADAVVRQAVYLSTDLIVMATRGRSGLSRALLGSVSAEVVRSAPVPVLLHRHDATDARSA